MAVTLNANTSTGFIATSDTSGVLQLQTGGTTAVTVDASQNVGIGTASPASDARLTLASPTTESYVMFSRTNSGVFDAAVGNNAGSLVFKGGADSATVAGLTEFMRIDSSGNVGIGTTTPNIYGVALSRYLTTSTATASGYAGLTVAGGSGGGGEIDFGNQTIRHAAIASLDGSVLGFYTNGTNSGTSVTERARIDSSGRLLVATNSTLGYSEKLGVAGTIATTGAQFNMNSGSDYEFVQRSAFKMNFYVNAGSVLASLSLTGVWTNASDARHKENITDSKYGLSTVMALKPRAYNLIDQADKPQIGFIAQEVLDVVPEVVDSVHNSVTDEDRYTLSYGNMVAVLTKAIQEQQALIQTLTDRITALEGVK